MIYNPRSRRMFLQGAGGLLLATPFFESLIPRAMAQTVSTAPLRYIQLLNFYGVRPWAYYNPLLIPNQKISPHVNVKNLSELPAGALSMILGPEISALRSKFSLLRGIDGPQPPISTLYNHNSVLISCASPNSAVIDYEAAPLSGQPSVDVMIANSPVVYPTNFLESRKQIILGQTTLDLEGARSFTWTKSGTTMVHTKPMYSTQALFDMLQSGFNPQVVNPLTTKKVDVMNAVFGDYKKVRDSNKLSGEEKIRFEAYMSLVADIQRDLSSSETPPITTCATPAVGVDSDAEQQFINQCRILVAAMACGLTRVASVTMGFDDKESHSRSHGLVNVPTDFRYPGSVLYFDNLRKFSRRIAFLMTQLDQITDVDGRSLLHNSLLYWATEFGMDHGAGQHVREDIPVFIGGGGGGRIEQGKYIDYRHETLAAQFNIRRGVPINNLLVTLMNCMGLSSAHYEATPGAGYGYYHPDAEGAFMPNEAFWRSTAGRRTALPVLYKGPVMG